jgi:oligopeptide transport system ATP-binding protein
MTPLLTVENLRKTYRSGRKKPFRKPAEFAAVDGVGFKVDRGEIFGIVGESGCGKTTTARLVLRLIEPSAGRVVFDGRDVLGCTKSELRHLRREMQLVFQDPMTALNPRMAIGTSIGDSLRFHGIGDRQARIDRTLEMLDVVGLSRDYFDGLPHEFSGGQCQRVGVARALILTPKLVVLDEPVSALDVSIRAQILNLLLRLQEEFGLTYIFISHDLTIVRKFCNRMAVLYLGKVVEAGSSEEVSARPLHPYTQALIASIPQPRVGGRRAADLASIQGELPSAFDLPRGCRFQSRCPHRMEKCAAQEPALVEVAAGHSVACFLHSDATAPEAPS